MCSSKVIVAFVVTVAHLLLTFVACQMHHANAVRKISASDLKLKLEGDGTKDNQLRILDVRTDFERETQGIVAGSELVPEDLSSFGAVSKGDEREVVVVTVDVQRAEPILKSLGSENNISLYLDGMEEWKTRGGNRTFPRLIHFEALSHLLYSPVDDNEIQLIDVRNRSELNSDGMIPNSFCLPLHEILSTTGDDPFDLSPGEFALRYGFPRPEKMDGGKRIVLTCRSGRRVLKAEEVLKTKGFTGMRIYSGSFLDWKEKGGKVVKGQYELDYD